MWYICWGRVTCRVLIGTAEGKRTLGNLIMHGKII
jgi:hypothetical protein